MADSYALEYPLNPEATLDPEVKPFDELEPPAIDPFTLNGPKVTELMTEAGLL
jgi:iron(III) transport system substrate-binding protein